MMIVLLVVMMMGAFTQSTYADTPMTAGLIMKEMPTRERAVYITGIVEGLAYARFRHDSRVTGGKNERGMKCIYNWLYKDSSATLERIVRVFENNPKHYPSVLLAVMIKKECGE